MTNVRNVTLFIVAAVLFVAFNSIFIVDQRELALKFRLGEIVEADYQPGIHVKAPFIMNVRKFDKRILTLDARPANYLTKEKKNVNVDFFVKWRISDVASYYKSMSGGNERIAVERLYTIVNDGLRDEFSKRTIQEVISGERKEIMSTSTQVANQQVRDRKSVV